MNHASFRVQLGVSASDQSPGRTALTAGEDTARIPVAAAGSRRGRRAAGRPSSGAASPRPTTPARPACSRPCGTAPPRRGRDRLRHRRHRRSSRAIDRPRDARLRRHRITTAAATATGRHGDLDQTRRDARRRRPAHRTGSDGTRLLPRHAAPSAAPTTNPTVRPGRGRFDGRYTRPEPTRRGPTARRHAGATASDPSGTPTTPAAG